MMKVELTPDVQAGLLAKAQESGVSLEVYVEQVLRERSREAARPSLTRSQIAGQRIRELRKGVTLGGIPVKELIDEGRERASSSSTPRSHCAGFEDEGTAQTESALTSLQNQEAIAWAPAIWRYEMLNGLGKGVARARLTRDKALLFWQELRALPVRVADVAVDEILLELALEHHLAVYDASYLSLAQSRQLPLATVDGRLQQAAESAGIQVIRP